MAGAIFCFNGSCDECLACLADAGLQCLTQSIESGLTAGGSGQILCDFLANKLDFFLL